MGSGAAIAESNESNNIYTVTGRPLPVLPPDLILDTVSIIEEGIQDGVLRADLRFDYTIDGLVTAHGEVSYRVEALLPGQSTGIVLGTGTIDAPLDPAP